MPETRAHPRLGDSHAIVAIAGMKTTAQGVAVRAMIERKMDSVRADMEAAADVPEARLRHSLGQLAALRWILEQFDEAAGIVERL